MLRHVQRETGNRASADVGVDRARGDTLRVGVMPVGVTGAA